MQKGRKGVRERKKFQIFQIFRPSLGKNSANKGKKKEVEGKFSPPYRQETPRAPCRARLRARCKKSGICVYTCQSARCKSHHVPRGEKVSVRPNWHGVSHHHARGHGVSLWADGGESLTTYRVGHGVSYYRAHTYGVSIVRAHAISLART